MRYRLRTLLILLAVAPPLIGCQPGGVVSLKYRGFDFEGCGGGQDFCECWVTENGLNNVYLTLDGPPGKRLSELAWEDFEPNDQRLRVSGTAEKGEVTSGVGELVFADGKIKWANIRASFFKTSGSADGPFIEFGASEGKGPTRKDIEAAFGKPLEVKRVMGRRGP